MASMAVYAVLVEVLRQQMHSFQGFSPHVLEPYKDIMFIVPLIVLVGAKKARDSILKREKTDTRQALLTKLRVATLVTFALCEVPALLGLALFLSGSLHREFYIYLACSVAAMMIYFPRYEHWEGFVRGTSNLY